MTYVSALLGCVALVVSTLRWARVAQREHYIPNCCWVTVRRWIRARPINGVLLTAGVVAATLSLLVAGAREAFAASALSVMTVAFPFWLTPWAAEKPVKWTRRLTVLISVTAGIAVAVGLALWAAGLLATWALPAFGAGLLPIALEAGLRLTQPLERRIAVGYQQRAETKLRAVAPMVIAITGSWGKTSTKNHVRDLAVGWRSVVMSPASFNNQAGLSRTMNEHLTLDTELLVVEMGMYGPGEIRAMCDWVKPDVGVITALGPMHMERVGSLEGILKAKAEILETTAAAVLWVESPYLKKLADSLLGQRVWRCGLHGAPGLDVTAEVVGDRVAIRVGEEILGYTQKEAGVHAGNVACAVAALLAAGAPREALTGRLETLASPTHRLEVARSPEGYVVVDDTFNSNPDGASAALRVLTGAVPEGRRYVVSPGMFELGEAQREANVAFAQEVASSGATLVGVGYSNRAALAEGAAKGPGEFVWKRSRLEARAYLRATLSSGDGVLWENDLPDHYP